MKASDFPESVRQAEPDAPAAASASPSSRVSGAEVGGSMPVSPNMRAESGVSDGKQAEFHVSNKDIPNPVGGGNFLASPNAGGGAAESKRAWFCSRLAPHFGTRRCKDVLLLLRPHQWLKNLFIFLPLFFDRRLTDAACWWPCLDAFFAYSLVASGIYCFNDIWDAEADKRHPKKCKRPVASGRVSKAAAYAMAFCCVALSFALTLALPNAGTGNGARPLAAIIGFYLVMNVAYCVRLKQIALVDVFIIATGFVLRVIAGGVVTGIRISQWIVLMTFLLALFLAFAKRRDDVVIYEGTGVKARRNVNRYNLPFMNQAISIVASVTMVCYVMYTVSEEVVARMHTSRLYLTSVFVLAGIMRYLQLTIVDVKSGSPTKVLMRDRFIQLCIVGWVAAFFLILYY